MQTRRLFLSVLSVGVLLGSSLAHAAQLNGLDIQQSGDKVQVILDTDSTQAVRVDRQEGSQTTLFLPKAKLPKAFQGTGLPPIEDAQAGVTAEVLETPEGLCIYLNSSKPTRNFYEIGFKRNHASENAATKPGTPKAPTAVSSPKPTPPSTPAAPTQYRIPGNLPLAKQPVKPATPPVQTAKTTAPAKAAPAPPSAKPLFKPQVAAKPTPPAIVSEPVKAPVAESAKPVVVHEEEFSPETNISSEEETLAQAITEEEQAYALIQQETSEPQPPVSVVEAPEQAASQAPTPAWYEQSWQQIRQSVTSPVSRWAFTALMLLGAFLFIASFVAVWLRKHLFKRQPAFEDFSVESSEQPAKPEFYEPEPETEPSAPETFDTYLKDATPPVTESPAWEPPPSEPTPKEVVSPRATTALQAGELLYAPAKTYGEAIRSVLKTHASPNVSAPFKPIKPEISTEGGPKIKRKPGGSSFHSHLK